MSNYAKVLEGDVITIIIADADFIASLDEPGWILVPEDSPACIGGKYDYERNLFSPPQPYTSWTWNKDTNKYDCPIAEPTTPPDDDKFYNWVEESSSWVETDGLGTYHQWNESTQAWDSIERTQTMVITKLNSRSLSSGNGGGGGSGIVIIRYAI